jgi:NAD-dependent deacetylase
MSTDPLLVRAADLISHAHHLTALTGAGISTASGIPDFRSPETGLWSKANPLLVATIHAFRIHPQWFYDWVRPLARTVLEARPNSAHIALAQLEKMGKLKAIVTQNIDSLHRKAGSQTVIEVHGHIRQATCIRCHQAVPTESILEQFIHGKGIPRCETCGGVLKPNVILYGEQLPFAEIDAARREARNCDLMLIAGSSLQTSPAAELPLIACEHGADVLVVNREPTPMDKYAALAIHRDLTVALPAIVSLLRDRHGFGLPSQ